MTVMLVHVIEEWGTTITLYSRDINKLFYIYSVNKQTVVEV